MRKRLAHRRPDFVVAHLTDKGNHAEVVHKLVKLALQISHDVDLS